MLIANGRPKMRDTVPMDASTALWSSKLDPDDDSPLDVVFSGSIMSMSKEKEEKSQLVCQTARKTNRKLRLRTNSFLRVSPARRPQGMRLVGLVIDGTNIFRLPVLVQKSWFIERSGRVI